MPKQIDDLDKNRGIFALHESFASDEEYNASSCLSYSKLKDLHDNPAILTEEKERVEKEWFSFGTLVDILLTTPEDFEKKVFVNDKVPSEQYKNIADYMIANNLDLTAVTEENVTSIYEGAGSAVNWLPATKKIKLVENCGDYLTLLTEHKGKLIVTTELFLEAQKVAEVFKTHHWTRELFSSIEEQEANYIEIFYQYKIKYAYEGLQCKSKFDIIVVDHDQKLISPFDIKTGNDSVRSFINHALCKYKYGYQGVLYKEGLTRFVSKIPELEDYEIDEFRFIYVSRQTPTFPLTLEMGEKCHRDFKDLGVYNEIYDIPSLVRIMAEAEFYINLINEGKTPTIPYDLLCVNGLVISEGVDVNNCIF